MWKKSRVLNIFCKVPQSSIEFQAQIQLKRAGSFSIASQTRTVIGRWVTITKSDIVYLAKYGKVNNYGLNHPDTSKIQ
jgi:hypothetical protein